MRIHLVFIGKTAFPEVDTGIRRYLDRLKHYASVEVHILRAEKLTSKFSEEVLRERESERILKVVGKQDYLVAWDQKGRQLDSKDFARFLDDLQAHGITSLWMVIGGPIGLSDRLLQQSNEVFSLSLMTFPHDLARLVVLEQIYRAFTILKREPYHR
jgi:23S rRNA (pseudouridine1915-N3)-methyltransferase